MGAVDGILQEQSESDVRYFVENTNRAFSDEQIARIKESVLGAYRWQYIFSGSSIPAFRSFFGA